jgi:hypothetical protein
MAAFFANYQKNSSFLDTTTVIVKSLRHHQMDVDFISSSLSDAQTTGASTRMVEPLR